MYQATQNTSIVDRLIVPLLISQADAGLSYSLPCFPSVQLVASRSLEQVSSFWVSGASWWPTEVGSWLCQSFLPFNLLRCLIAHLLYLEDKSLLRLRLLEVWDWPRLLRLRHSGDSRRATQAPVPPALGDL